MPVDVTDQISAHKISYLKLVSGMYGTSRADENDRYLFFIGSDGFSKK